MTQIVATVFTIAVVAKVPAGEAVTVPVRRKAA
jgi:hypothetical protein